MRFPSWYIHIASFNPEAATRLWKSVGLAVAAGLLYPVPIIAAWLLLRGFLSGHEVSLWGPALASAAAIAVCGACRVYSAVYSHQAAFGVATGFCAALMEHLGRVPLHWLAGQSTGGLKKVLNHDIGQVENFIAHNIPDCIASLTLPLVSITILVFVSWQMALVMLLVIAAAILVHVRCMKVMQNNSLIRDHQAALNLLHKDAVEFIQGMPDIKIFNRTADSFARMQVAVEQFKDIQGRIKMFFVHRWIGFLTLIATPFALLAVAGAYLHLAGGLPLPDILLFIMLGGAIFAPFSRLVKFVSFFWRAAVSYSAAKALLDVDVETEGGRKRSEIVTPDLAVRDLRVEFAGKAVLDGVSFTAKAGTVTAIVGPSGSGKSTLAAAIAGMERIAGGGIDIDGVPLGDLAPGELSKAISVVFQQPFIFSGTVTENLTLGAPGAGREAVEAAARMVQCDELIASFPDGYDTRVGSGGAVHLSGGQRQRLALARMALHDAPVVLLDEATAFVDPESESAIQAGLSTFLKGRTVLVIAHRLPSIARAHNIIVLDQGRIAESGAHDILLAQNGLYARMWEAYGAARDWTIAAGSSENDTGATGNKAGVIGTKAGFAAPSATAGGEAC